MKRDKNTKGREKTTISFFWQLTEVSITFELLFTHAKATPVATATALPPELPPAMYQSVLSMPDVLSTLLHSA